MPPRRPTDLASTEQGVASWLGALPRAAAPRVDLACAAPARAPRSAGAAWRPFAAAAALLLALLVPTRTGGAGFSPSEPGARPTLTANAFAVVDDPSVPALHAFDTFEQLAWASAEAGAGR